MNERAKLHELSRQRGGPITRDDVAEGGLPTETIDAEVKSGHLLVQHPGVYLPAAVEPTMDRRMHAALLAAGSCAVLSHRSAALRHSLVEDEEVGPAVEILLPHDQRLRLRGVIVRRTRSLPLDHVVVDRGVPTTSVHRTLCDLGASVRPALVARALERAVIGRRATVESVYNFLDGHGRQGRNGTVALRRALEDWLLGDRPPDSALELMLLRLVVRFELPPFEFQYDVASGGDFVGRVDMAWPGRRLAVEVDGHHFHASAMQMQRDWDRQNALVGLGWCVLRFTWHDVVRRPQTVADQIARQLARLG